MRVTTLNAHIAKAEKLVGTEIRDRAKAFRIACFDHMHVISELPDQFSVVPTAIEANHVTVTSQQEDPKPLAMTQPKALKIGDQNIQALATVYEPSPVYPVGLEIKGKGFTLSIGTRFMSMGCSNSSGPHCRLRLLVGEIISNP